MGSEDVGERRGRVHRQGAAGSRLDAYAVLAGDEKGMISRRSEGGRDVQAVAMLGWYPKEKRKGVPALRLYDLDNHLINEIKAKKAISLSPNKIAYSIWQFQLSNLAPGIYRIDVLLDTDAVWRTFFRINE